MRTQLPVARVITEKGRLRNLRLQAELQGRGVGWDELRDRAEFEAVLQTIGKINLCLVAGFSYILPQGMIDRCRDVVNIHPGILQQCRGPQPVAAAILRGHPRFGVTAHRIDSQAIDAGPILAQRSLDIDYSKSYGVNYARVKALMVELVEDLLPAYTQAEWPTGESWVADEAAYFPRASNEEIAALVKAPTLAAWAAPGRTPLQPVQG